VLVYACVCLCACLCAANGVNPRSHLSHSHTATPAEQITVVDSHTIYTKFTSASTNITDHEATVVENGSTDDLTTNKKNYTTNHTNNNINNNNADDNDLHDRNNDNNNKNNKVRPKLGETFGVFQMMAAWEWWLFVTYVLGCSFVFV